MGRLGRVVILLDTCALLWLSDPGVGLPPKVVEKLRKTPISERFVSAITAFEIGYKHALGKLDLPFAPKAWFQRTCAARGLTSLPVTDVIALRAASLPRHHRDPADRFIISTAMEYNLTILTADREFENYDVAVLWA